MEDTNSTAAPANNRTVMILLGIIVILLAAIVAFVVFGKGDNTAETPNTTETTATAGMGAPSGATQEEAFDPATATAVAAGKSPEQHVIAYFDAVVAGDFSAAYKMLPTAKQAEYGSEDAFSTQLTGYGITSYTIDSATESGDEAQVTATAVMEGGNFQYLWTFAKDGDNWLVKSRTLPGMN